MLDSRTYLHNAQAGIIKSVALTTIFAYSFFPVVASAQVVRNIKDLGGVISTILQNVIAVLIGVAVVVFLWAIFRYLTESKNEAKREEAKKYMIFGIIAIFIMVSVWGVIGLLNQTTGIQPFLGLPGKK